VHAFYFQNQRSYTFNQEVVRWVTCISRGLLGVATPNIMPLCNLT